MFHKSYNNCGPMFQRGDLGKYLYIYILFFYKEKYCLKL